MASAADNRHGMQITEMDRGRLRLVDGGRFVDIEAEMLLLESGTRMGFAIYPATIRAWQTASGPVPIDEMGLEDILAFLREEFARKDRYLDLVPGAGWRP